MLSTRYHGQICLLSLLQPAKYSISIVDPHTKYQIVSDIRFRILLTSLRSVEHRRISDSLMLCFFKPINVLSAYTLIYTWTHLSNSYLGIQFLTGLIFFGFASSNILKIFSCNTIMSILQTKQDEIVYVGDVLGNNFCKQGGASSLTHSPGMLLWV